MKFLDLFAGIGGFRLGMEAAGHECIGYVEWDKFARKSYEAIHDTEGEWTAHDITTVTDEDLRLLARRGIDVICGGFPCQAFSVAGKRGGFSDTRGTMFFEIARFAKQIKPRFLFLENVKGLLSHDKGNTFGTILHTLDELGYDTEWQVLNSKNFSTKERPTPQNRERVFIIGHLRGSSERTIFPIGRTDRTTTFPIETLDSAGDGREKYTVRKLGNVNPSGKGMNGLVYDTTGLSPTLTTNKGEGNKILVRSGLAIKEATKKGYDIATPGDSINYSLPNSKTRRARVGKGIANTLDTGCQQGVLTEQLRIRRLTPLECFRLQGFPDELFHKAQLVNSNSQLYKQAGNSVCVNVVYEIARRLKN